MTDCELPWPVLREQSCLVATHWPPDVDGLACAAAWSDFARALQPNARIALFAPGPVPDRLTWIVEGLPFEDGRSLEDFGACLVLDCAADSERTRLPRRWLSERAAQGRLYGVDHHAVDGSTEAPALACVFMDQGMRHPLFFASIWSDTRGLKHRQSAALPYLTDLFAAGLDDAEVTRQQRLLDPQRPEMLLRDLIERTEVVLSREVDGVGRFLVVASARPWRHVDSIHEVRELALNYADVVVVIDQRGDSVSMWSSSGRDLGLNVIASELLGGGGHPHMAGGPLGGLSPEAAAKRLLSALSLRAQETVQ